MKVRVYIEDLKRPDMMVCGKEEFLILVDDMIKYNIKRVVIDVEKDDKCVDRVCA